MLQVPNILQGPEPVETAELHFKLNCKLKVFETDTKFAEGHCCVLAVSQYYGLVFVGNCNGFSVIQTKTFSPTVELESFPKKDVVLDLRPTHISVDFSQKILAVICHRDEGSVLIFYNIQSFSNKDFTPLKITLVSELVQNSIAGVIDLTWQPNPDGILMLCLSDGSVLALSQGVKGGPVFSLPSTTQATCFCWSPKGKQIVIGSASGILSQYKPDLKLVKTLPAPAFFNNAAMVVSVLWISNYQFAVAYNDRANPESFPVITIVNTGKNEPVNVINYDDITYSTTLFRNHQIYMTHHSAWNLIFISSANSIEVAVLHSKDGSSWEQWLLGDASRAELPLNPDRQETFPLGWAFDFTSQETIPWGEGTLPPMPRLLIVSDEGLLCVFNVVNAGQNAPQLCSPPKENLDDSLFVASNKNASPPASEKQPLLDGKSLLGSPPVFGNSKPTYNFETSSGFGGFVISKSQNAVPQGAPIIPQQQTEIVQIQQAKQMVCLVQFQQQQSQPTIQIQQQQSQPTIQIQQQQSQPTIQIQQQQPQPAIQIQQKQQQQLNQVSFAHSATNFKPSTPQSEIFPSFSFGSSLTSMSGRKVVPSRSANITKSGAPTITVTVKPPTGQGDIFGAKNLPQTTSVKQPEATSEKAVKKPEETAEIAGKTEDLVGQGDSPGPGTPELAAVDDSVYFNAVLEEIDHFNSELLTLTTKVGKLDLYVGHKEDKANAKKSIDELSDFCKELKETTEGQSGEIHSVLMDLMEAFAWLEDAKSRNLQRKNPSYVEVKKSEELDPLSARHMNEIGDLKYYIENQLKQLSTYLEKEWMDNQDHFRKEIKSKMTVPPLEEVYKTMHYQLKILHKQKTLIQELKEKIGNKKRKNKPQSFFTPTENSGLIENKNRASELSKLAENLLQLKINQEENTPRSGTFEMMKSQLNAISERSKKLNGEKQATLRDALSECDRMNIRPLKTKLESSTFFRSLFLAKMASLSNKAESVAEKSQPATGTPNQTKTQPQTQEKDSKVKEKPDVIVESEPPKTQAPEKPLLPATGKEGKSPLDSLSGIVSSIGNKNDTKTSTTPFVFGTSGFQKSEPGKDVGAFGSLKLDQKQKEPKKTMTFTFGTPKVTESIFSKKEPTVFGAEPVFSFANSNLVVTTKQQEVAKTTPPAPNVTITVVTSTAATTASSPFTFTAVTTPSTGLPKVNLFMYKNEQSVSGLTSNKGNSSGNTLPFSEGTSPSGSHFHVPSTTTTTTTITSASTAITPSVLIFGNKTTTASFGTPTTTTTTTTATATATATTTTTTITTITTSTTSTTTPTTSLFGSPKTTPETSFQSFTFIKNSERDSGASTAVPTPVKATSETEEVDVVKVDELEKKPETPSEKKDPPKMVNVFGSPLSVEKTLPEVVTPSPAPNIAVVSTPQTSTATTNVFAKPVATSVATTSETVSSPGTPATTTTTPSMTAASAFSFSTVVSPTAFGQTATTTSAVATTTSSLLQTSAFGQVFSTTPTTNIFGGSTPTRNVFGGSAAPDKKIFGQEATPTTTTTEKSIFGESTPTTPGQVSTSSTSTTFGQKPDSVSQTANLFGQLLSDSSRPVFGTSSPTTTTNANVFGTMKNFFGGTTSTTTPTTSLFGTTSSSVFPQTTSVFGQPTTSPSIFGKTQTSTSNSLFAQNVSFPFGSGTSVTSNKTTFESEFNKPIFGQSTFGQTTNNTSVFGGSFTPIFGNTSSTTASNVFQTPTTSTTFGSTPGPFSGGTSSFGKTSFGSTSTSFQKPFGGFGSPPVFGAAPVFGGSPSFGSLPTFGSMSQTTFGQTTDSATFENLANQNTGFGNLAQQSQNQGFGSGFRSSSFENKPNFSGNSFSSWRSK